MSNKTALAALVILQKFNDEMLTASASMGAAIDRMRSSLNHLAPEPEPEPEPEPDWANLPVDTPVMVRMGEGESWSRRHLAYYKGITPYPCHVWFDGKTRWSSMDQSTAYRFYRLPGEDEK